MNMWRHFNHRLLKTHFHTMKGYNTRPVSLTIKVFFSTTKVFTCSKVINALKR